MAHTDTGEVKVPEIRSFRYDRKRPFIAVEKDALGGDMMQELARLADEFGWRVLDLGLTGAWVPEDPPPIGALIRYPPPTDLTRRLGELNCPCVRLGSLPNEEFDAEMPAILKDLEECGRMGAEHLYGRGFESLAYVANAPFRDGKGVYDGFQNRAKELGCTLNLLGIEEIWGSLSEKFESRAQQLRDWIPDLPKPVGIMTYSDKSAAQICYVCDSMGIAVPEEVAVLGLSNNEAICELAPVSLSSIAMNPIGLVREALRQLHRLIQGEPHSGGATFIQPLGVVVRHSTDVLAVRDVKVSKAIRFLWDNLDVDLSVSDVAVEVGASRRSLERAFKRELGRGIGAELRRKRMERCCELLVNTDLTVAEMLPLVGLASKAYLHRIFLKTQGMTPNQYRKKHTSPADSEDPGSG